jgi:hypothetical protein
MSAHRRAAPATGGKYPYERMEKETLVEMCRDMTQRDPGGDPWNGLLAETLRLMCRDLDARRFKKLDEMRPFVRRVDEIGCESSLKNTSLSPL